MCEMLSEVAYYTNEEERRRKILRYRTKVWELFKEQMAIDDYMRVDVTYRENLRMMKRLAGALVVKLHDESCVEMLRDQIKEYYPASMVENVTKALESMFREACGECISKESEVRSYLRDVQSEGKL